MTRLEVTSLDGRTVEVDGRTVHLVPSEDASAFAGDRVRLEAVRMAAEAGDVALAERLAAAPVLSDDEASQRVVFVSPDEDLLSLLDALGDDAWSPADGLMRSWLSSCPYVIDGVLTHGCREPFADEGERLAEAEFVASRGALSMVMRRRLVRRVADTPVAARD